ncbi:MAG: hypothetical protein ABI988_19090, partial [Nitrospirota bacterium]
PVSPCSAWFRRSYTLHVQMAQGRGRMKSIKWVCVTCLNRGQVRDRITNRCQPLINETRWDQGDFTKTRREQD